MTTNAKNTKIETFIDLENPNIWVNTVINEYNNKEFSPKPFWPVNFSTDKEFYKTPEKSPHTLSDIKKVVKKYKTYLDDPSKGITKDELDIEVKNIINSITIFKLTKLHNATIVITPEYLKTEKANIETNIMNKYNSFFILPDWTFDYINWNKTFQSL